MFTIDLLKGKAIPLKSRPEGIAIAAVTFTVPVIVAMAMFAYFIHCRVVTSIQKQRMVSYQQKTRQLASAIESHKNIEQKKAEIDSCMSEIWSSLKRHSQWTDVLITITENIPASVVLTELSVKQRSVRMKVPKDNDPKIMVGVTAQARTLKIKVAGRMNENLDEQIRNFRDVIRACPSIEKTLKEVRVSQGSDILDGENVISYEIDYIFKPQL